MCNTRLIAFIAAAVLIVSACSGTVTVDAETLSANTPNPTAPVAEEAAEEAAGPQASTSPAGTPSIGSSDADDELAAVDEAAAVQLADALTAIKRMENNGVFENGVTCPGVDSAGNRLVVVDEQIEWLCLAQEPAQDGPIFGYGFTRVMPGDDDLEGSLAPQVDPVRVDFGLGEGELATLCFEGTAFCSSTWTIGELVLIVVSSDATGEAQRAYLEDNFDQIMEFIPVLAG